MSFSEQELRRKERLTVVQDGEETEVFNWVNVNQPAIVRGHNPVVDTYDAQIGAGDSSMHPDAVTHWVAEELRDEFNIDPEDHDIEVIDPTDEEVGVL
ncbi:hypothetical protein [Halomicrobium urmianum]|uniref:hypothetical protein n=1 Tax=Halomicrobium urmianum TaxID=1586233 RepID=UPI001CDA04E7|nr:hypothetical protein [Halomicrobium urmianum]